MGLLVIIANLSFINLYDNLNYDLKYARSLRKFDTFSPVIRVYELKTFNESQSTIVEEVGGQIEIIHNITQNINSLHISKVCNRCIKINRLLGVVQLESYNDEISNWCCVSMLD